VLLIRKHIAGLDRVLQGNLSSADVDGDGDLSMKDVLRIRRKIAGLG
ncbi:MAG: hypothetical protein IJQ80_06480, partial [Clostridia bacterium]|nr:hypothetical protein [Clostridia bacterium]